MNNNLLISALVKWSIDERIRDRKVSVMRGQRTCQLSPITDDMEFDEYQFLCGTPLPSEPIHVRTGPNGVELAPAPFFPQTADYTAQVERACDDPAGWEPTFSERVERVVFALVLVALCGLFAWEIR